jgi:hypothetical protein
MTTWTNWRGKGIRGRLLVTGTWDWGLGTVRIKFGDTISKDHIPAILRLGSSGKVTHLPRPASFSQLLPTQASKMGFRENQTKSTLLQAGV